MMLTLYAKCGECGGSGVSQSPEWHDWYERKAQETVEFPAGPEPVGPEEWPCHNCDGTGSVLTEEGQAVATLVRRILEERDDASSYRSDYAEERAVRRQRQQDAALFEAEQRANDAYYETQRLRDRVNDMERKARW